MGTATTLPPAPPARAGTGGGGSEWVELTRAQGDIEAHLLTGRLNDAGVETRAMVDRGAPGAWLHGGSNPWATVTILVRRRQLDDARIVLAEISLAWDRDARADPPAGSARPRWLAAAALGVLVVLSLLVQGATAAPCSGPPRCR
ncbi:MAG TPA: DUF2007 domain-containing protein [Actinomycetota bacterium]|nr:DUF2007 domain-containing protein [Actinomycetota bacterium]